jgi:pimeloyl-ACP methyl ester carboxylesterase
VHGLGNSKDNWRGACQAPALRERSLLAFDLPGFGHSSRSPELGYALEDHAGVLASVIDAYAVRSIHIVAHSMGGTIALLLPARILARLQGLFLVEPRLCKTSCGIAAEAAQGTFERFNAEIFPRFRKRYSSDPRVAFDLDRADPEAFYTGACSLVGWTERSELVGRFAAVPCRKGFIYGQRNRHLDELRAVDDALQFEIAGAGHFVMDDNPGGFYAQLGALLPPAE